MNPSTLDINNRFDYHKPTLDREAEHSYVRSWCKGVALYFDQLLPDSREKALALTKLEEAMFWANASIARNAA